MNALNLSASRRRDKVVILDAIRRDGKSKTQSPASMLRSAILTAFSPKVSLAVAAVCLAAMWASAVFTQSPAQAQEAMGRCMVAAMPWLAVWTVRAARHASKEGGEL